MRVQRSSGYDVWITAGGRLDVHHRRELGYKQPLMPLGMHPVVAGRHTTMRLSARAPCHRHGHHSVRLHNERWLGFCEFATPVVCACALPWCGCLRTVLTRAPNLAPCPKLVIPARPMCRPWWTCASPYFEGVLCVHVSQWHECAAFPDMCEHRFIYPAGGLRVQAHAPLPISCA